MIIRILSTGAAGLLCACGAAPLAEPPAGQPPIEPTLAALQGAVFTPGCALGGCHDAVSRAGELDLSSADATHAELIGVDAANDLALLNGWVRVEPEDPDRSFLIRKLEGPGPGEGSPMPSAVEILDPYYLERVRTWIDDGALP